MTDASRMLLDCIADQMPVGTRDGHFCVEIRPGKLLVIDSQALDECEQNGWIVIHDEAIELTARGMEELIIEQVMR